MTAILVDGVSLPGTSSPTLTRIGYDGTANTYTGPASGGAAFDSHGVWGQMTRINVWEDGSPGAVWNTRCYTDTDTTNYGPVMVRIPRFLYWADKSNYSYTHGRYYIADPSMAGQVSIPRYSPSQDGAPHPLTDDDTHPLFIVDGEIVDYAYVSAFEGYLNSAAKIESTAGKTPSLFATNTLARTYAENRDLGWELMTIQAWSAIQALFMVEYARLDSQAAIGNGITGAAGVANTGATGSTGTDRGNATYGTTGNATTEMCYRGIENIFGNMQTVIDGLNVDSSLHAWIAPQSRNRSTYCYAWAQYETPYVDTETAWPYVSVLNGGSGGSYIMAPNRSSTSMPVWPNLPYTGGGSSSTYWCDKTWMAATGNNVLLAGGRYDDAAAAGMFAQRFTVVDTVMSGARLQYLPSAVD